jgi:hypothetical protein
VLPTGCSHRRTSSVANIVAGVSSADDAQLVAAVERVRHDVAVTLGDDALTIEVSTGGSPEVTIATIEVDPSLTGLYTHPGEVRGAARDPPGGHRPGLRGREQGEVGPGLATVPGSVASPSAERVLLLTGDVGLPGERHSDRPDRPVAASLTCGVACPAPWKPQSYGRSSARQSR